MTIRLIISLLSAFFFLLTLSTPAFSTGSPFIASHGVNFASGNKYHSETDISIDGPLTTLSFTRYYNSQSSVNGDLGLGWSHSFFEKITPPATATGKIKHIRPDGKVTEFIYESGSSSWISE